MNKELLEKLEAVREDLMALWVCEEVTIGTVVFQRRIRLKDTKEMAELLKQKVPTMWRNYKELLPYMTIRQRSRARHLRDLESDADRWQKDGEDHLTDWAKELLPWVMTDVNNLSQTLEWLVSIADHMGCPVSELLRYRNEGGAMNQELLEKLWAIREDLLAFQAQAQAKVGDEKKLAELVIAETETIFSNFEELARYMTLDQKVAWGNRMALVLAAANSYLRLGKDSPAATAEKHVPLLLADLDDIAEKLEQG